MLLNIIRFQFYVFLYHTKTKIVSCWTNHSHERCTDRRWWFSWRSQCAGAHRPLPDPPPGCLDTGEARWRRVQGVACVGSADGGRAHFVPAPSPRRIRALAPYPGLATLHRPYSPSSCRLYSTAQSWLIRILTNPPLSKSLSTKKMIVFNALSDSSSSLPACCTTCASYTSYNSADLNNLNKQTTLNEQTTVRVNSIFSIYNYV